MANLPLIHYHKQTDKLLEP